MSPNRSYLYCDSCGKIHKDKPDFVMCDCGRVAVRMEWATEDQIKERQRDMNKTDTPEKALSNLELLIHMEIKRIHEELALVTSERDEARREADRWRNRACGDEGAPYLHVNLPWEKPDAER